MSAYKISVEMCLENIFYFHACLLCLFDIRLCFSKWINNCCFAITFHIISTLCQTPSINLFYFHIIRIEYEDVRYEHLASFYFKLFTFYSLSQTTQNLFLVLSNCKLVPLY